MSLSASDHLGPYEIRALIGKGGMGEIYRARDPDRMARFQREAEVLASVVQNWTAALKK